MSSVKRSISFKRPQDMPETKFINHSIFKIEKNEDEEENQIKSKSTSSSKEHIYDNLDLFKRHKLNIKSDVISNENELLINNTNKTREQSMPITTRLRPVTMHIPPTNDKQTSNEFENVFNQLKKRTSIKQVEEPIPTPEESVQTSFTFEETSKPLLIENEPVVISPIKKIEKSTVSQSPIRRKTVGGVNLIGNNKVAVDDNKPTPSWIDIAKQKQNKL